jgi:hypothetical protein
MSRLWNNPPTTPDGRLDFARLMLAEIHEDLAERVGDVVVNGGQKTAAPLYKAIADGALRKALKKAKAPPSEDLVRVMRGLADREAEALMSPEALELARQALEHLRAAAGVKPKR